MKSKDLHCGISAYNELEIYCQAKSDWYDMVNGYANGGEGVADYVKVSSPPKWLEAPFSYKGSFVDWENKVKGEYLIQLTHARYLRRAHTDCDNLPWLREALQNPIWLNPEDAAARGIKTGDTVRVFNDNGQFLRLASATRTVMPGVIVIPHGAGARIDPETGIDISGADNMLTASNRTTTPFLNGWNSNLVQYEKYDGPIKLIPDCEMPQIIPLAEEPACVASCPMRARVRRHRRASGQARRRAFGRRLPAGPTRAWPTATSSCA